VEALGLRREVDSEGGVVAAEAPLEAEEALVQEGKLWWSPTDMKVRTFFFRAFPRKISTLHGTMSASIILSTKLELLKPIVD